MVCFMKHHFIRAIPKFLTLTNLVKVRISCKRNGLVNEAFSFIRKLTKFITLINLVKVTN